MSNDNALLIEALRTIRGRLDELASISLSSYTLSKQNEENLRVHMKRSDANEKNIAVMKSLVDEAMRPIQWFKMTGMVFAWVAGVSAGLISTYTLYKMFLM